ncbi:MAG: sigma-70 family RNA polymerase sigma factor [Phycisphaerae bacterium]|nr:sigma-70 family RNA polymerase sigma factor [Phycisphaerae bacterium]
MSKPREAKKGMVPDPRREEADLRLRCLSDEALNGDEGAAQELWRQVRLLTYKLARILATKHGIQDADIDDIVQNVVLALWRLPSEELLKIESWHKYLFASVFHRAINHYHERRRRARREVALDPTPADGDMSGEDLREVIAGFHDTLSEVYARELAGILNDILKSYKKEKAEIFCLYLQGYMHREIAERFNMPLTTVSVIIYRMKHEVNARLDSIFDERI